MIKNDSKWLLLLACGYFTFVFCSLAVIGILPLMSADLGATSESLAGLVATFAISYAVTAILSTSMLHRFSSRTMLITGLSGVALGALMLAFAQGAEWAHFARVIQGASAALIGPTASSIAYLLAPAERKGSALSFVFSGTTMAMVVGVPIALWLGGLFSWRWVYVLVASISLLCAVLCPMLLPGKMKLNSVDIKSLIGETLNGSVLFTLMTTLLRLAAQFTVYSLIARVLVDFMGFEVVDVGMILLGYGVAGVMGAFLGGPVSDRYGSIKSLRIIGFLTLVSFVWFALLSAASSSMNMIACIMFWGVVGLMFSTPQQKLLCEINEEGFSVLLSLNSAFIYIGMAVGGYVSYKVSTVIGLHGLAWAGVVLVGFSIVTSEIGFICEGRKEDAYSRKKEF